MNIQLRQKEAGYLLPTDIIFQTFYWSQVKSRLGWKINVFDFTSESLADDVLVLTNTFTNGIKAAYVPQGPESGPDPEKYGIFLESLSEEMITHIDPSVAFIRFDLPWESQYAAGSIHNQEGNGWSGHPEARLREMRMNFGTKSWNLRKAVTDLTVADTLHLDLAGGEDDILSGMKPKTRYNIRLAKKKGVKVFLATEEMLPIFYELYRQTAERNGFYLCEYKHFSALFSAIDSNPDSSECLFLLASHGHDFLAGAIVTISGRTATYLYGASSDENRNLMGSYAIQWEAVRLAMSRGCLVYDMGAVTPTGDFDHQLYGMYRFKTGFGGKIFRRNGSWDFPLSEDKYTIFRNLETLGRT
jgi:lipid II:glycine glycyltransferase (peptidoglycan interpeptide bridge formation enzyme)